MQVQPINNNPNGVPTGKTVSQPSIAGRLKSVKAAWMVTLVVAALCFASIAVMVAHNALKPTDSERSAPTTTRAPSYSIARSGKASTSSQVRTATLNGRSTSQLDASGSTSQDSWDAPGSSIIGLHNTRTSTRH